MSKMENLNDESLSNEDEALLEHYDTEPGYFKQAFGLFHGTLAWVMWLVMIVQILLFAAAVYSVWMLFATTDLMTAVRWGVIAVIAVQIGTFLRGFMGTHFEANRVLREVKRLELRLVRMQSAE